MAREGLSEEITIGLRLKAQCRAEQRVFHPEEPACTEPWREKGRDLCGCSTVIK